MLAEALDLRVETAGSWSIFRRLLHCCCTAQAGRVRFPVSGVTAKGQHHGGAWGVPSTADG